MEKKKNDKEKPKEVKAENTEDSTSLIRQANEAAERLEKQNQRLEENLAKLEAVQVERTLGGTAEAGVEEKKEETPEDYAKRIMENDDRDKGEV